MPRREVRKYLVNFHTFGPLVGIGAVFMLLWGLGSLFFPSEFA